MAFGKQATQQESYIPPINQGHKQSPNRASTQTSNQTGAQTGAKPKQQQRRSTEPDLSKMRKFTAVIETPEERKVRLIAKTINVTFGVIARLTILGVVGYFAWQSYLASGGFSIRQFILPGLIAADLGRVLIKASKPGTK